MATRVLIISASIGSGHVAAARALESACHERGLEATHVDLLDYTTAPFRRLYRQAYFELVRSAPEFVDWLGRRLDRPGSPQRSAQERLRARLVRLISYHLPRLIQRTRPEVILHTHFLAPEILSTRLSPEILRLGGRERPIPQAVVVTDFFAHSFWMQPKVWRYFVATDEVAAHLAQSGVPPERVVVSGIPIDLRFAALPSRAEARARLGWPQERDCAVLLASGLSGRALHALLAQLKGLRWPLELKLVLGRSANLLELAQRAVAEAEGLVRFEVVGYTGEMPAYMAAADLLIGKPGGLSCAEALAAGLPFALVQPYPIQEEANSGYLLEQGVAIRLEPLTVAAHKLRRLLEDATRRERMRAAALATAKPEAARTVVRQVLEDLP